MKGPKMVKVKPVVEVGEFELVEALVALIRLREGGTARELAEAREEAQRRLRAWGFVGELPRY